MAQRISRAKRTVSGVRLNQPGDVATVLRVLYLVFNEGYSGDVDLAAEAIRLTRQLAAMINHEEVAGLLALSCGGDESQLAAIRELQEQDVVVVPVEDEPGAAAGVFQRIADAHINVRYSYLATGNRLVIAAANPQAVLKALSH